MNRKVFVTTVVLVLGGCVAMYEQPVGDAPAAFIEFAKGYKTGTGFGTMTLQLYSIVDDDKCANVRRSASFSMWQPPTNLSKVHPTEKLKIVATIDYSGVSNVVWTGYGAAASMRNYAMCEALAEFDARAGHEYSIIQEEQDKPGSCKLKVFDKATGAPPTDLTIREDFRCPKENRPR
jgi:hypothetical protein